MTPKNRTLEGKNRTLGGRGGQKSPKIVGHHLCTFPNGIFNPPSTNVKPRRYFLFSSTKLLLLEYESFPMACQILVEVRDFVIAFIS